MTDFKQVKNNAKSFALVDALNNTTSPLSFGVEPGEGSDFPDTASGSFWITAWDSAKYSDPGDDPKMRVGLCTARSGDNLTVTWGQLGTPIIAIAGRPAIALYLQDQHLKDVHTAVNALERNSIIVVEPPANLATDARQLIADAIAAVSVTGGEVHLRGKYRITGTTAFSNPGVQGFKYAFRVPSNVAIVGHGAMLIEDIDYTNRRVMFFLDGSNIRIEGLTISNEYNMAGGSRPTSVPVGAGNAFDADAANNLSNILIKDCTFLRSWHPVKIDIGLVGLTASGIRVIDCYATHEPTADSSGGYNFRTDLEGSISSVTVIGCHDYDSKVSAGVGIYGVHGATVSGCRIERAGSTAAGVQVENGGQDVSITGNTMVDCDNGVWVDDSESVSVSDNIIGYATSSASHKAIRVTHEGFTGTPAKVTRDIVIDNNICRNGFIICESFGGAPAGSLDSITISNNKIRLDGVAGNYGIYSIACPTLIIDTNTIIGAVVESIRLITGTNDYLVVQGNITRKVASESSSALNITGSAFRPVIANNQFVNGTTVTLTGSGVILGAGNAHNTSPRIIGGSAAPEGAVSAGIGSVYLRTGGGASTSFYVKESGTGNTGWVAK